MDFVPNTRGILSTSEFVTLAEFAVTAVTCPDAVGESFTISGIALVTAASVGAETVVLGVVGEQVAHDLVRLENAVAAAVTSASEFFGELLAVELRAATVETSLLTLRIPFAARVGAAGTLREFSARGSVEQVADGEVGEDVGEGVEGKAQTIDDVRNEAVDGHASGVLSGGSVDEVLQGHQCTLVGFESDTHDVDVVDLEDGGHEGVNVTNFGSSDDVENTITGARVGAFEHAQNRGASFIDDHSRLSILVVLEGLEVGEEFREITSEAAASSIGAHVGGDVTQLNNTNSDTRVGRSVGGCRGASERSVDGVAADTFENTSNSSLLTAHGKNTVSGAVDGEDDVDSIAAVEALILAFTLDPEAVAGGGVSTVAGGGVLVASLAVATVGGGIPAAARVGVTS